VSERNLNFKSAYSYQPLLKRTLAKTIRRHTDVSVASQVTMNNASSGHAVTHLQLLQEVTDQPVEALLLSSFSSKARRR